MILYCTVLALIVFVFALHSCFFELMPVFSEDHSATFGISVLLKLNF